MDPQELALLAARARAADAVLFFIADRGEGEGEDRPDMGLPAGMNEALTAVLAARPDAVVIDESGAPVAMPWAGQAHALVQYGFSGMEGGDALARVVFGEANPSGRLAVTFPRRLEDSPAHALRNYNATRVNYAEGVFMGYRWFDAKRIEPQFPFGFGLSYTTFEISKLRVSAAKLRAGEPLKVTAEVKNTGNREGAEVVQLYVGDPSALVPRPSDELKGFEKVMLKPGETKVVEFDLDSRAFSYWNVKDSNWTIDPGSFSVLVGDSSRNLNNRASVTFF